MLIAELTGLSGGYHLGVLGSCRVHCPLLSLRDIGVVRTEWYRFNAFTHGASDGAQYLNFVRGLVTIPDELAPFIFSADTTPAPDLLPGILLDRVEILVLEVCADTALHFDEYVLQQDYFYHRFVRRHGSDLLNWWRSLCSMASDHGKVIEATLSTMSQNGHELVPLDREILERARFERHGVNYIAERIDEITNNKNRRYVIATHFIVPGDFGSTMNARRKAKEVVIAAAAKLGIQIFDPSVIIEHYGRARSLAAHGADIYHYDDQFNVVVGQALAAELGRLTT
jgi:hypothetical protein